MASLPPHHLGAHVKNWKTWARLITANHPKLNVWVVRWTTPLATRNSVCDNVCGATWAVRSTPGWHEFKTTNPPYYRFLGTRNNQKSLRDDRIAGDIFARAVRKQQDQLPHHLGMIHPKSQWFEMSKRKPRSTKNIWKRTRGVSSCDGGLPRHWTSLLKSYRTTRKSGFRAR
jgi:hypothetical protein